MSAERMRTRAEVRVVDAGPPADPTAPPAPPVACVDVGSTFTKLAAVEPGTGRLRATASHPTTLGGDVLTGVDACLAAVSAALGTGAGATLACSSAGGGLRLAVVGQERLVSAEAGRRVALSAGARVVAVHAGRLDGDGLAALRDDRPDVVLLTGGTDGGDGEVLLHNAAALAAGGPDAPVVVAGNADARDGACARLAGAGRSVHPTANVLPDIGEIDPEPARAVIRDVFLRHVIGGKGLSGTARFARMVRAVTPDAVFDGVRVLADAVRAARPDAGGLLVVDVGGATSDVYSVPVTGEGDAPRHAVGDLPEQRTVEGDLGVRWSAPYVVDAALAQKLDTPDALEALREPARRRADDPGFLPASPAGAATDLRLAVLAATVAVRRHLRNGGGLLGVSHVVCSGGVFRHADPGAVAAALDGLRGDPSLRGPLGRAHVTVDRHYVLAAAGMLAAVDRPTATALVTRHLA